MKSWLVPVTLFITDALLFTLTPLFARRLQNGQGKGGSTRGIANGAICSKGATRRSR